MKKNRLLKKHFIKLLNFIIAYLLLLYPLLSILNIFYSFKLINLQLVILSILILLIVNIFLTMLIIYNKTIKKIINDNNYKIISSIIMIGFFLSSIQPTIFISENQAEKVLTIQWIIFTATITLFIFWNRIIPNHIDNITPNLNSNLKGIEKLEFIYKMDTFNNYTKQIFFSITYLIINTITLLLATSFYYLRIFTYSIFVQSTIIFCFFLTINAFLIFLLDISLPIYLNKQKFENIRKEFDYIKNKLVIEGIDEILDEAADIIIKIIEKNNIKQENINEIINKIINDTKKILENSRIIDKKEKLSAKEICNMLSGKLQNCEKNNSEIIEEGS